MTSDIQQAFEENLAHLSTAERLVERAGEGNMTPGEMAALAQAHVFVGVGKMLTAAFEEEYAEELEENSA
jgi:hypothetical protein